MLTSESVTKTEKTAISTVSVMFASEKIHYPFVFTPASLTSVHHKNFGIYTLKRPHHSDYFRRRASSQCQAATPTGRIRLGS